MTDRTNRLALVIADALEKLVDAYVQALCRDGYLLTDRYAANEARQREEELEDAWQSRDWESVRRLQDEAEQRRAGLAPDPLDENDHRDRIDSDGGVWRTSECGYWHLDGAPQPTECPCWQSLARVDAACGPLAFAPDAAPDAPHADLTAPEGDSGAEEGNDADEPLCPECRHVLHNHMSQTIPPATSWTRSSK